MSSSASPTVLTGPAQGVLSDSYGVQWQINEAGAVVAGDKDDNDKQPIMALTFINGLIWRQTKKDQRWSCKHRPHDPWSPPVEVSPLPVQGAPTGNAQMLDVINLNHSAELAAISVLKADLDATATAAWDQIAVDQDAVMDRLSAYQTVLVTSLNQIAAAQAANQAALVAPLDQILNAVTTAAPEDREMLTLLNQIVTAQAAAAGGHADTVALLKEILAAVSGAAVPPAIATLQTDFTNLTQTLNGMVLGISASLQQILALLKPTTLAPDLPDATHVQQPVPKKG